VGVRYVTSIFLGHWLDARDRCEMNTGTTTTLGEVDGEHRLRDWKWNVGEKRFKSVMRTQRASSQEEVTIGKKGRMLPRTLANEAGLQMTTGTTAEG
jgi:hypothetical protein